MFLYSRYDSCCFLNHCKQTNSTCTKLKPKLIPQHTHPNPAYLVRYPQQIFLQKLQKLCFLEVIQKFHGTSYEFFVQLPLYKTRWNAQAWVLLGQQNSGLVVVFSLYSGLGFEPTVLHCNEIKINSSSHTYLCALHYYIGGYKGSKNLGCFLCWFNQSLS